MIRKYFTKIVILSFFLFFASTFINNPVQAISNNCDSHVVVDNTGTERYTFTNNETLIVIGRNCTGVAPYTQADITFVELNPNGTANTFSGTAQILTSFYSFTINTNQLNPTKLPSDYEIQISVDGITTLRITIYDPAAPTPTIDPVTQCSSFNAAPNPVTVGNNVVITGSGCPPGSSIQEVLFYESGNQTGSAAPVTQNGTSFSIVVNSGIIGGPGVYDVGVNLGNGTIWLIPNAITIIAPISITPPDGPIPAEYVPCDETNDTYNTSEYHSLRPYQASPCNPRLEALDLYCANDLITKETFVVSPAEADSCEPAGAGILCHFSFESVLEVSVDLTDAELPILGNTQLVPNQVNGGQPQPEQFSYARRVNEYLTWWLEGASWKADEELMDPDEIDVTYPQKHIISYAGPIRKLYPEFLQQQSRSDRAGQSRRGQSHNQIFECTRGTDQVPCRWNEAAHAYQIIDDLGTPDPTDDIVIYTLTHRVEEGGSPESPWMLFTSTEDRLGSIYAILDDGAMLGRQPTAGEGNEVTITSYDFIPNVDTDLLYFAHMEESVSLVDLLQRTYTPRSISRGGPHLSEPASYYNTYRCDLKDVRWNTGDDLFGEVGARDGLTPVTSSTGSEATGESIDGLITYSGEFQCQFDGAVVDRQACINDCSQPTNEWCDPANNNLLKPNDNYLYEDCRSYCENEVCGTSTCTVNALTATSLYTETPKAEELWDRTVVGDASMFRRMMPALGSFGEILKDYPAVTSAEYSTSKVAGGFTTPSIVGTYAGDPIEEDPGSNAELYIPHLGGIKVLTMDLLQDLLRPHEMNSKYLSNGIPPGTDPTNCRLGDGFCSPENLATYFSDGSIQKGIIASIICERESGGYAQALNDSCTNSHDGINNDNDNASCVDGLDNSSNLQCTPCTIAGHQYYFDCATLDFSAGLFQHNLLVVCADLRGGQGTLWDWNTPPWCTPGSPGHPDCLQAPWCEFNTSPSFEACKDAYFDPVFNTQEMVRRSSDGTSWGPWCTGNAAADCGIPGC